MHGSKNVPGKPHIKEAFDFKGRPIPTMEEYIRLKINKVKQVYEDEDFIIDLMKNEDGSPMIRV